MTPQAGSDASTSHRNAAARPSGLGPPRVVWTAFAISAVVHLLAVFVYPVLTQRGPATPPATLPRDATPDPRGLQVVELVEVPGEAEPERPDEPEELEDVPDPVAPGELAPDLAEDVGAEYTPPPLSAAERLRPRFEDAVIWRPVTPERAALTLEQRLQIDLAARLEVANDSLAAAAEARSAATDWTYTDDEGKRWGVSPGKLHLGDITLPLPFTFGAPLDRRDETRRLQWEWEEVQRGAAAGKLRDSWKERAQAIRARRDRERAEAKADTSGIR